ncbi:actin-binding protein WASF2-like [Styela clava]
MPFPRHLVEPKHLCQGLQRKGQNERVTLHEYSNLILANFIRQLATLSGQVDQIFGTLLNESANLTTRLKDVKSRLDNVEQKVNELDSLKEEVGVAFGRDKRVVYKLITERGRFYQSDQNMETGLFMQNGQPIEVTTLRETAEALPKLHELDKFRTDNKQGSKIYSNPDLFFMAWQDSLQQMIAEQQNKSDMKAKRTVRQTKLRRVKRAKASRIINAQKLKMGVEFIPQEKNPTEEEDEYFTDEEWSSSEDERECDDKIVNGNVPGGTSNLEIPPSNQTNFLPPPPTPPSIMNGESASREYNFEDIDIPAPDENFPPPISLDSLKINGDFPPPMQDYSGISADYDIQTALNSMKSVQWGNT